MLSHEYPLANYVVLDVGCYNRLTTLGVGETGHLPYAIARVTGLRGLSAIHFSDQSQVNMAYIWVKENLRSALV